MSLDVRHWWRLPFTVQDFGDISVVREDLLPGGSKLRFLPYLIPQGATEVVFGGPFCGGAPLALSVLGREFGIRTTLFYAQRKTLHRRQLLAQANGARIVQVPMGFMTNVQAKARTYAQQAGACFLPLGFDLPAAEEPFIAAVQRVRRDVGTPAQVWCATGSGMLARCLGRAFPESEVRAIAVGLASRWKEQPFPSNVTVTPADLPFARESHASAPFDCCPNYERKAWEVCVREGRGKRLFWNVLGV